MTHTQHYEVREGKRKFDFDKLQLLLKTREYLFLNVVVVLILFNVSTDNSTVNIEFLKTQKLSKLVLTVMQAFPFYYRDNRINVDIALEQIKYRPRIGKDMLTVGKSAFCQLFSYYSRNNPLEY